MLGYNAAFMVYYCRDCCLCTRLHLHI